MSGSGAGGSSSMASPLHNIRSQLERGNEAAITSRESSTAVFGINSADRYGGGELTQTTQQYLNPTTPYNFIISQNQTLFQGFFSRLAVTEANFNWTMPTITERNNRLGLVYFDTPVSNAGPLGVGASFNGYVELSNGWYTPTTIASTLQALIRTATSNGLFTVTADSNGALFFNSSATTTNDQFYLTPVAGSRALPGQKTLYEMLNIVPNAWAYNTGLVLGGAIANSSTCRYIYPNINGIPGIQQGSTVTLSGFSNAGLNGTKEVTGVDTQGFYTAIAVTVTESNVGLADYIYATTQASGIPTMLSTEFVDIVCTELTSDQAVKDGSTGRVTRDVLCRLYLNPDGITNPSYSLGSAPFTIKRIFNFPKQIRWLAQKNIGNLNFIVYDDRGCQLTTGSLYANGLGFGNQFSDVAMGDWQLTLLVSEN
jgi:hypothetical protein